MSRRRGKRRPATVATNPNPTAGDILVTDPAPVAVAVTAEPAPEPAPALRRSPTALLLDETTRWLSDFVALPNNACRDAVTLWVAHTHVRDRNRQLVWDATPRLAITSDLPASGKSTLLNIVAWASFNGYVTEDPSGPGVLQCIHEHQRTVAIDEFDVLVGKGAGSSMLRAILNGGAYRGATVTRRDHEDTSFGPIALCGLGQTFRSNPNFAATRTRSIEVALSQRPAGVELSRFRRRLHKPMLDRLSAALTAWGRKHAAEFADPDVYPEPPAGIADRAQDIWEPLLAVAEVAGGDWPDRARAACLALALSQVDASEEPPRSPLQQLLIDAETAFRGEDRLPSGMLCERLGERGWPLECDRSSAMELARLLEPAGVEPHTIRIGDRTPKGYYLANIRTARELFVPEVASVATTGDVATISEDDDDFM